MNTGQPENDNSHYFTAEPHTASSEREYNFTLNGRLISIVSDRGVFSMRGLDKGTAALMNHIDREDFSGENLPPGDIVDLGCGAGPLTVALALQHPDRTVWGVDVNERALDLTARNARLNHVHNVRTTIPDEFPDSPIAAIWSNPPIRIGKEALHSMLEHWLSKLGAGGHCFLVVSKNLGGDSLQRWIESLGYSCERIGSKSGFRIFDVSHA